MKKLMSLFLVLCLLFVLSGCENAQIADIKVRGKLIVGVKSDVPDFGYLNPENNTYEGLEIDIAKALAKGILGDEKAISFEPVTSQTRDAKLNNHEVDFIIATFTITEARKKSYNFTQPYYTDKVGFLVRKDSKITAATDMTGLIPGAARSSTAYTELTKNENTLLAQIGFWTPIGYNNYEDIWDALVSGKIDVFVADKSILRPYLNREMETVLLSENFAEQPYGIATRKTDKQFSAYLNSHLQTMKDDGTLQQVIDSWVTAEV